MFKERNTWKRVSIVLLAMLILMVILFIIWPERNRSIEPSRLDYVESTMTSLYDFQKDFKENKVIDDDNDNIGEYSSNLDTLPGKKHWVLKEITTDYRYMHYNYSVKMGSSIDEREKSFEIYAVPKICYPCDESGDGIISLAIDETGVVRYDFCNIGDTGGNAPEMGTMKKWPTLDEYYKSHQQSFMGKILRSAGFHHYK
jgi:hypothetical protein